jgi:hypothetical protein
MPNLIVFLLLALAQYSAGQGSLLNNSFLDDDGQLLSMGYPPLPPTAQYVLGWQNAALDVPSTISTYTDQENIYFEGFDVLSLLITPVNKMYNRSNPLDIPKLFQNAPDDNGNPTDMAAFIKKQSSAHYPYWKKAVKSAHVNTFFSYGYMWFRSFFKSNYDILGNFVKSNNLDLQAVHMNVTFALNEAYNTYRAQQQKAGYTVSIAQGGVITCTKPGASTITTNVKSLPESAEVLNWMEKLMMQALYKIQALTHYSLSSPTRDAYGYPKNNPSYNQGAMEATDMYFFAGRYTLLIAHYFPLLSDAGLIAGRKYAMALFTAFYNTFAIYGWTNFAPTNQWLLRIDGCNLGYYAALQSEKEMRRRGIWSSSDQVAKTDTVNGVWMNADMQAALYKVVDGYMQYHNNYGMREHNSCYYGYALDIMSWSLSHPADDYIYSKYEIIYSTYWLDIAMNFHPGTGTMTGARGRDYDLFTGSHMTFDQYEVQSTIIPYELALASSAEFGPALPWTIQTQTVPMSFQVHKWNFAQQTIADLHYKPLDVLSSIMIGNPYRVVEGRFAPDRGQDRMNFISPRYSVGHAGTDKLFFILSANAVVRLSGVAAAGWPRYFPSNSAAALQMIRLFPTYTDNPGIDAKTGSTSTSCCYAGADQQLPPRQVVAQYQSFMLVTQLVSPGIDWYLLPQTGDSTKYLPVSSNLIVPLAVDGNLYADGVILPRKVGTKMSIDPKAIITIRHGRASSVVRLAYYEYDKTQLQASTGTFNYTGAVGGGVYPYTVMWVVDDISSYLGFGRLIVQHQNRRTPPTGVSSNKMIAPPSYHISWIIGAGDTDTDAEMTALQQVLRNAQYSQTLQTDPSFNYTANPSASSNQALGKSVWAAQIIIGQNTLRVERTDSFWPNGAPYANDWTNTFNVPPFYTDPGFNRMVNGVNILQWGSGEFPFRGRGINPKVAGAFWQPHKQVAAAVINSMSIKNYPSMLPLSGTFNFDATYSCAGSNIIRTELYQASPYVGYGFMDTAIKSTTGTVSLTFNIKTSLPGSTALTLRSILVDANTAATATDYNAIKLAQASVSITTTSGLTAAIQPLSPSTLPAQAGTYAALVSYTCPLTQCVLVVDFLQAIPQQPNTGYGNITVNQGTGTAAVNVTISAPPANGAVNYFWSVWMVDLANWAKSGDSAWAAAIAGASKLPVAIASSYNIYCGIQGTNFPSRMSSSGTAVISMLITCSTDNPAGTGNVTVVGQVWRATDNSYWGTGANSFNIISGRTKMSITIQIPYAIKGTTNGITFSYWAVNSLYWLANPSTAWKYSSGQGLTAITISDAYSMAPPPLPPYQSIPPIYQIQSASAATIGVPAERTRVSLTLSPLFNLDLMQSEAFLMQFRRELAFALAVPTMQVQIAQIYAGRTYKNPAYPRVNYTVPVTQEEAITNPDILWNITSFLIDVDLFPLDDGNTNNYWYISDASTGAKMLQISRAVQENLVSSMSNLGNICLPNSHPRYEIPFKGYNWGVTLDQLDCYYLPDLQYQIHNATVFVVPCPDGSLRRDCSQNDVLTFTPPVENVTTITGPVPVTPAPPSITIPVAATDIQIVLHPTANAIILQELRNPDRFVNLTLEDELASLTGVGLQYIEVSSVNFAPQLDQLTGLQAVTITFNIYPSFEILQVPDLNIQEVVLDNTYLAIIYGKIQNLTCKAASSSSGVTLNNVLSASRNCSYYGALERKQAQLCQPVEVVKSGSAVSTEQVKYKESYCGETLALIRATGTQESSSSGLTLQQIGIIVGSSVGALSLCLAAYYIYYKYHKKPSEKFHQQRRASFIGGAYLQPAFSPTSYDIESSPSPEPAPARPAPPPLPRHNPAVRMRRMSNDPLGGNLRFASQL